MREYNTLWYLTVPQNRIKKAMYNEYFVFLITYGKTENPELVYRKKTKRAGSKNSVFPFNYSVHKRDSKEGGRIYNCNAFFQDIIDGVYDTDAKDESEDKQLIIATLAELTGPQARKAAKKEVKDKAELRAIKARAAKTKAEKRRDLKDQKKQSKIKADVRIKAMLENKTYDDFESNFSKSEVKRKQAERKEVRSSQPTVDSFAQAKTMERKWEKRLPKSKSFKVVEHKEPTYEMPDGESVPSVVYRNGEKVRSNGYTKSETATYKKQFKVEENSRARRKAKRALDKTKKLSTESGLLDKGNFYMDVLGDLFESVQDLLPGDDMGKFTRCISFIYQLYRSRNLLDYTAAFMAYASDDFFVRVGITYDKFKDFVKSNYNLLKDWSTPREEITLVTESGEDASSINEMLHSFVDSKLFRAIRDFIVSIASTHWFGVDFTDRIYKLIGDTKGSVLTLVLTLAKAIDILMKSGKAWRSGVPFKEAFFTRDPTKTLIAEAQTVLLQKDSLYYGLPVEGMFDAVQYSKKVETLLNDMQMHKSSVSPNNYSYASFHLAMAQLDGVFRGLQSRTKGVYRYAPVGVVVGGSPHIGKSLVLEYICRILSKVKGRRFAPEHIFTKNPDSKHWDGHNPPSQPIIKMPEVARTNKNIVANKGDEQLNEILALIDSQPYVLQYAFGEKGKIYACPEMLLLDTNEIGLNADVLFNDPSAVKRRLLFITFTVKQEFRKPHSVSIDKVKSFEAEGHMLDRYNWHVYIEIPSMEAKKTRQHDLYQGGSLAEMTVIVEAYMTEHFRSEAAARGRVMDMELLYPPHDVNGVEVLPEHGLLLNHDGALEQPPIYPPHVHLSDQHEDEYADPILDAMLDIKHSYPQFRRRNFGGDSKEELDLKSECGDMDDIVSKSKKKAVKDIDDQLIEDIVDAYPLKTEADIFNMVVDEEADLNELTFKNVPFSIRFGFAYRGFKHFLLYCWYAFIINIVCTCLNAFLPNWIIDILTPNTWVEKKHLHQMWYNVLWKGEPLNPYYTTNDAIRKWAKVVAVLVCISAVSSFAIHVYNKHKKKTVTAESDIEDVDVQTVEAARKMEIFDNSFVEKYGSSNMKRISTTNKAIWNNRYVIRKVAHTSSPDELKARIYKNVRFVVLDTPIQEKRMKFFVLGLHSNIAITNKHNLCGLTSGELRISTTDGIHVADSGWKKCKFDETSTFDVGNDLIAIELLPERFGDITSHFQDSWENSYNNGLYFDTKGEVTIQKDLVSTAKDRFAGQIDVKHCITYDFPNHKGGMCGLPIISAIGNGYAVCGIHFAGQDDGPFCVGRMIFKSEIDRILQHNFFFESASEATLYEESKFDSLFTESGLNRLSFTDPVNKSAVHFEILHNLKYLGKLPGVVNAKSKSKLTHTRIAKEVRQYLESRNGPCKEYTYPAMQSFVKDGVYYNPYNRVLVTTSTTKNCLEPRVLRKVVKRITDHCTEMLLERSYHGKMGPISICESINGLADDKFSRSINASTSGGIGFPGVKDKYVPLNNDGDKRYACDDLVAEIDDCLARYKRGECNHFTYKGSLKDEAVSLEKAANGKTRMFYGSALENLVISRMYLSKLYTTMCAEGDIFCSSVGIDIHKGANELFTELLAWDADRGIEGDYENYDITQPYGVGNAVMQIIINIYRNMGVDEESITIIKGILTDNLHPQIEVLRDVFEVTGIQTSGMYGTAENNCLKNLVLFMYSWYYLKLDETVGDFYDYLLLRFYGDDVIGSSKTDLFNNQLYSNFCKVYYGMKYTDSNKKTMSYKFLKVRDMSYLKRHFRNTPQYFDGKYMAFLDQHTICRALTWQTPSKFVSTFDQIKSTCQSMLWEYAIFDPEDFDNFRSFLASIVSIKYDVSEGSLLKEFPVFVEIENTICGRTAKFDGSILISQEESCLHDNYAFLGNIGKEINLSTEVNSNPDDEPINEWITNKDYLFQKLERLKGERAALAITFSDEPAIMDLLQSKNLLRDSMNSPYIHLSTRQSRMLTRYCDLGVTIDCLEKLLSPKVGFLRTESGELKDNLDYGVVEEVQNLQDVGGDYTMDTYKSASAYPNIGQREALSIEDFFKRPIQLGRYELAIDNHVYITVDPWDLYTQAPSIRAKLKNSAYLSCTLHVRIAVSGTQFHYGRIMVSYQPFLSSNKNISELVGRWSDHGFGEVPDVLLNYLSQSPESCSIDVKSNKPVDMTLPFISEKPMFRLFNESDAVLSAATPYDDLHYAGELVIATINPVKSITTAPSQVSVQVFAWATDVKLGTITGTKIALSTESGMDEFDMGPVEQISTGMARLSGKLTDVPVIGPLALASHQAFGKMGEIASLMGWSKPPLNDDPMIMKNMPFQNGAQTIGTESVMRITVDPKQELTVDPRICGSDRDDMVLKNIYTRMSFLTRVEWGADYDAMTPFWFCRNTPRLESISEYKTDVVYQPTAASFAATPFFAWNGKCKYRFEIVGSAYHRGKIGIGVEPNVSQSALISNYLGMNKNFMIVVDIQETTCFEVEVDWLQCRQWCEVTKDTFEEYGSSPPENYPTFCNGFLYIFPFTSLQSPDGSNVVINVYTCMSEMNVNGLTYRNLPTSRVLRTESGIICGEEVQTLFKINETTGNLNSDCMYHFGESISSFRPLLKRYALSSRVTMAADTDTTPGSIKLTNSIYPPDQLPYGSTEQVTLMNLFSYLKYAYVGYRGGIRKRIQIVGRLISDVYTQVNVTLVSPETVPSTTVAVRLTTTTNNNINGMVTFTPHNNAGIEVELPFYSLNLFHFSFSENPLGDRGLSMIDRWFRTYAVYFDNYSVTGDLVFNESSAAAEDFSFLRFQGAPPHN